MRTAYPDHPMEERLNIHFKIAGHDFTFKSTREEEIFLREADRLIRERIEVHRNRGVSDIQVILTIVALESLVTSLKADEQSRLVQSRLYDRLAQLSHAIAPSLA